MTKPAFYAILTVSEGMLTIVNLLSNKNTFWR